MINRYRQSINRQISRIIVRFKRDLDDIDTSRFDVEQKVQFIEDYDRRLYEYLKKLNLKVLDFQHVYGNRPLLELANYVEEDDDLVCSSFYDYLTSDDDE